MYHCETKLDATGLGGPHTIQFLISWLYRNVRNLKAKTAHSETYIISNIFNTNTNLTAIS